jgi:hypothetical protein
MRLYNKTVKTMIGLRIPGTVYLLPRRGMPGEQASLSVSQIIS